MMRVSVTLVGWAKVWSGAYDFDDDGVGFPRNCGSHQSLNGIICEIPKS